MNLLILYSDSRQNDADALVSRLAPEGHSLRRLELRPSWDDALSLEILQALRANSHWVFLSDSVSHAFPSFLFAAGFCLAVGERGYFLGSAPPPGWTDAMRLCADLPSLVDTLRAESVRWQLGLARLEAQKRLSERGVEFSNTAFVEAVEGGDQQSCELFLQAGFSADVVNRKGVTVLCLAVRHAHNAVLRLLLENGADVNLRSRDRDNSPLMDAAAEGQPEIVQELIARGADLTGVSRNGQNALVLAIGKGAQDIATLLLDAGADPFVADKLGMNACQYAQLLGRKEFLERVELRYPGRL